MTLAKISCLRELSGYIEGDIEPLTEAAAICYAYWVWTMLIAKSF